ncbi:hypothetical protein [Massilia antarctica]|uniref:hypothetical protein n=1 Tax=Massilia antarctica TaxID=2765360 RepID=UPI0006BB65E2|nr:hypothetical protein [Massilia sp. H27-R4]MCY0914299.1 hypothetical protein [Massilia sp. H27-R4]
MFEWFKKAKQSAGSSAPQADDGHAFFNALRHAPDPIPAGEYAMWFQSLDEESFSTSASFRAIDGLFQATAGIEEAVLALILRQLGKVGPGIKRVSLPDDTDLMSVLTGDKQHYLVSVNQEKGIRLHFHHATPVPHRIAILDGLAAYVRTGRPPIEEMYRREGAGKCAGAQWWAATRHVAIELEANADPVKLIGKLVF